MKSQNKKSGFTLVEIAFALAILATSTVMILTGVLSAKQRQSQDEDMLVAVLLSNNKMVEVENQIEEDIARKKFPDE